MDISIDYSSPAVFSGIITAFFAFFILFRNYRLHLNALFGVLAVLGSAWFFLLNFSKQFDNPDIAVYILVLPAILSYFLFLLLNREESLTTSIRRILPEKYLYFPAWASLILGVEIFLIGVALFTFILLISNILDLSLALSVAVKSVLFYLTLFFLAESSVLTLISAFRLFNGVKNRPDRTLDNAIAWIFGFSWLLFSLGCLIFSYSLLAPIAMRGVLLTVLIITFLTILLVQALVITRRYFLSYKVLLTQFIASLIVIFNLISILNSGSVEEIVLRAILIIVLAFLSHLLVRSVTSEIQKRKQIQDTAQKIYDANKTLHKLDRAKSEFIGAASHQLRSPLSVIKGISSMLLDGSYGKISGSIKDALEKVYISNERLIGLIESLLNISHLDEGKVDFNFAKININDVAEKAVGGLALQAQNKKLYLKFSPWKKSKLFPWVDESKVTEAISNLVDNAIKYTRKGGVKIEVKKAGNNVRVNVIDTGIGLRKDEIKHLFQKFVRTGRGNKMSTVGTGLGLYVVRKMIEAHKGRIWAESAGEGRGSSFIIELPLNLKNPPNEKFIKSVVMEKNPA